MAGNGGILADTGSTIAISLSGRPEPQRSHGCSWSGHAILPLPHLPAVCEGGWPGICREALSNIAESLVPRNPRATLYRFDAQVWMRCRPAWHRTCAT